MSKRYDLGHIQVFVTWEEFLPNGKEPSSEKVVIFFPGWPLKEGPVKGMRRLGEEFANNFVAKTYLIYTQSKQVVSDPMYHHALAVCKFLAEKKLKSIILAGHSQGAIKAIYTAIRLQEANSDIQVEGLILINSSGLNDISGWTFLRRQVMDLTIKTLLLIIKESAREPSLRKKIISLRENLAVFLGAGEFLVAIWKDLRPSLRAFYSRFVNEVVEGTTRSPYLDQVRVPIILIQGTKDRTLNNDRTLVQEKTHPDITQLLDARTKGSPLFGKKPKKQIFVEDLFPHSPYVRLLRAEKLGNHLLPIFRPRAVAQASLCLLKGFKEAQGLEL